MSDGLDRSMFTGRRHATMADLRRLLDMVVDQFVERSKQNLTITVVATVADLPANAKPTEWFRVTSPAAERVNVYVGNGPTLPLSRFTTTPV